VAALKAAQEKDLRAKEKDLRVANAKDMIISGLFMDHIHPKALKVKEKAHLRGKKERVGRKALANPSMALAGKTVGGFIYYCFILRSISSDAVVFHVC
jgi:hypothetical protein